MLYLLPFHPIGVKNRKGRNNTLVAGPDDPGSPYAIGGAEGGHFAVHPELGTEQDVRDLCATAHQHGMDVALDIALNASADHPWLTEHPEWFQQRPDGTLKYAENPPKRYQDIYNFNWDTRRLAVACGTPGATSSCTGSTAGSSSTASTTRTRSRSRSGSG